MSDTMFLWFLFVVGTVMRAFFAAAELAVAALDPKRLQAEAEDGDVLARKLLPRLAERERLLGIIMAGSTVSIAAHSVGAALLLSLEFPAEIWLPLSLLVGMGSSVLADRLPRAWAQARALEVLSLVYIPLRVLAVPLMPFVWFALTVSRVLARFVPTPERLKNFVTREELREMLQEDQGEEIKPLERQMLTRVLDFSALTVEEVMIPLIEVQAIRDTSTIGDARGLFTAQGHSRVPVYHERIDDVVGLLFAFDVLYAENTGARVRTLMRRAKYVPESSSVDKVLADLQKSRMGMAVVVNEYGGAVGIVTLEDILEQIVGDIEDEFDRRDARLRRLNEREYLVSARLKIDRLAEALSVTLPDGDYETVGGLLLAELGHIPRSGETCRYGRLTFSVRKATDRVIKEVHVLVEPEGDDEASD